MTDRRVEGSVEDLYPGQPASVEDRPQASDEAGGRGDIEGGAGERPLRPEVAAERADAIDAATAGDGVQFFEGNSGGDAADVECGG